MRSLPGGENAGVLDIHVFLWKETRKYSISTFARRLSCTEGGARLAISLDFSLGIKA